MTGGYVQRVRWLLWSRRRVCLSLLLPVSVVATGCGVTVQQLPLPQPGHASNAYTVHAIFDNALNLPDQAKVKIGGSDIGTVSHISAHDYQAVVDLRIDRSVQLPHNVKAELRQATPLGDVYVALSRPADSAGGPTLQDGDTLPAGQTSAGATVEELLLSVSLLVNGGGVAGLAKLTTDLDAAVGGKPQQLADLVRQLTDVTGSLHNNSQRIDSVLSGLDNLMGTIEARHSELSAVADTLPGMIGVIASENRRIGELLAKVAAAGGMLGDFADSSSAQLASLLDNVHQLMSQLVSIQGVLGPFLDGLQDLRPAIDATFRGNSLAMAGTVTGLDLSLLSDPAHSSLFSLQDANDFVGSLIQVLQIVDGRLRGGQR